MAAWQDDASIKLIASTSKVGYTRNEPIVVTARLIREGAPLPGANVEAAVRGPEESLERTTLLDDGISPDLVAGDGVYTGTYSTTEVPGMYRIAITATGTAPAFSRQKLLVASVSASDTRFTGATSDHGIDTNGNGLYDILAVDVGVNVTAKANYLIVGELTAADGTTVGAISVNKVLRPGFAKVRLPFSGEHLFKTRKDGPYTLSKLVMSEEQPSADTLMLDDGSGSYQTAGYSYRRFEHASILFDGSGTDRGVDTNDNGLYDRLDANVSVEIVRAGRYNWSARLVDSHGTEIGFDSGSIYLNSGGNRLQLRFNGKAIGKNGIDGPYRITDMLIYSRGTGESASVFTVYRTSPYKASEFEGFNRPPTCETAKVSPDVIWPPNHRLIPVSITGVTDPEGDPVTLTVGYVLQDEPTGSAPDAVIQNGAVSVRAERAGSGSGRIYEVVFHAEDMHGGDCVGKVRIAVPHDQHHHHAKDDGVRYDSNG